MLMTLGDFKHVELKDFLIEKFKDSDTTQNFRIAILLFLGRSECTAAREILLEVFKDENEDLTIRSYAVNALARINDKESGPEILKTINSIEAMSFAERKKYYNFYMYCVTALTRLGDSAAFDKLMDSLRSDNAQVRGRAVQLLGELKDQRSIDILRYKAEHDPEPRIQNAAKAALKELGIDIEAEKKEAEKK
jgi:HEAT repeat protein